MILFRNIFLSVLFLGFQISYAQSVNQTDSLALIAFYNQTDGPNWNRTWELYLPVGMWEGITVAEGRVVSINLRNNNLYGALPAEMGNLTHLIQLDLTGNQVNYVPGELRNLRKLETLNLSQNSLSGAFPQVIFQLENLLFLSLAGNQLNDRIPAQIGNLRRLQTLALNQNQFYGILPAEIGNLQQLMLFDASDNQLDGAIPETFKNLRQLRGIDLNRNQIEASSLEKWNLYFSRRANRQ